MRHALRLAGLAIAGFTAVACDSTPNSVNTPTPVSSAPAVEKTLQVDASPVVCTGVTQQTCLRIRETSDAAWSLLYDGIVGFDYEPGFLYEIRIKEETVANPPADASSVRRTLLSVLSKTPVGKPLPGSTWRLTSIDGRAPLPGVRVTAEIADEDRIAGTAGCNRYTGRAAFEGDKLQVGPLAVTRMACLAGGVMEQEDAYLSTLGQARFYHIVGNELRLGPSSDVVTLVYQRE